MTIESSTTSVELEGNGSAREFSFSPIKIFDATQLEVVLRDTDGTLTTLTSGTGSAAYSVQATFTENEASTGSIRYPDSGGTLLTAGQFLNIRRVVPFKQETNIENQGGYLPEVQEATHDLHIMRALQLQEELSRTVKVAFGSDVAAEDYLSTVAASAATASAAATTATTKAGEASASAIAAAASEVAAEAAKDDAEAALAAIGTSVTDAANYASAAAASETAAEASATAASGSASAAASSASTATTQATNASNSASTALSAQTAAEAARDATLAAYDNFDDRYLGAKASDPTLDNDGNALVAGSLYFNTTDGAMKIYTGSVWVAAYVSGTDFLAKANNLSDLTNAVTARTNLGLGTMATQVASGVAITGGSATAMTALAMLNTADAQMKVECTSGNPGIHLRRGALDWIISNQSGGLIFNFESTNVLTVSTAGLVTAGSYKTATGATVDEFSIDGTLAGNSDTAVPTEKAVKTYVDGKPSGGLVLLTSATASNSASLAVTFSGYDRYLIVLNNFRPATNAVDLTVNFSQNGGSSYVGGSAHLWNSAAWGNGGATNLDNNPASTGVSLVQLNAGQVLGNTTAYGFSATLTLETGTVGWHKLFGNFDYVGSDNNHYMGVSGGVMTTTGSVVNALRFQMSSGNISIGTVRVYGIVNS